MIDQITTYANMIETVSSKRGYPPVTNAIKAALLWFLLAFSNANLNLEDILILFQIGEMWREFNGSKREARLYGMQSVYINIWIWECKIVCCNETKQELSKPPFFRDFGDQLSTMFIYWYQTFPEGFTKKIKIRATKDPIGWRVLVITVHIPCQDILRRYR